MLFLELRRIEGVENEWKPRRLDRPNIACPHSYQRRLRIPDWERRSEERKKQDGFFLVDGCGRPNNYGNRCRRTPFFSPNPAFEILKPVESRGRAHGSNLIAIHCSSPWGYPNQLADRPSCRKKRAQQVGVFLDFIASISAWSDSHGDHCGHYRATPDPIRSWALELPRLLGAVR